MARKDVVLTTLAPAQSLAANFTGPVTVIRYLDNIAYQINVTTSNSTGTFKVQGSLDYTINEPTNKVTNTGNWADLPLTGSPVAAAANDVIVINMNQLPYNAIRLVYTSTVAGTGTAAIYLMARQLGG